MIPNSSSYLTYMQRVDGKKRSYLSVFIESWESDVLPLSSFATMKASTSSASTSVPVAHNALPPPSGISAGRSSRIAPHSHIKGLGLTPEGFANNDGAGFVGQTNAREVRISPRSYSK
jgi:hypothetical protein